MDTNHSQRGKKQKASEKLADALAGINSDHSFSSMEDNEMLSLMVDETLKGVDITIRYPAFYKKLLGNAELRQAFLDAVESIESEEKGEMLPLPGTTKPNLAFLTSPAAKPGIEKLDKDRWKIKWQKTIEQLQTIFFPQELAYRSDANLFDDAWFTLLRGEVSLNGSIYAVLLECGISKEMDEALSPSLNLAVTLEPTTTAFQAPLQATLAWGKYSETLAIGGEGRVRFPDIPFAMAFDKQDQSIVSELDFSLEVGT